MPLRVVFMGTPAFSVPTLGGIVGQGHQVVAAYCQPPRPAGRGMAERRSPVHEAALGFGIPVHTPRTLRDTAVQGAFSAHRADAAVVVAYGLILPRPILDAPREGCLNLHASLLPRWRGAAPIQRAIMAGDRETGVCAMRMEEGLDTGPVCLVERMPIDPDDTAGTMHDRLATLGADMMLRALGALERGGLACVPQAEDGATYAAKIDKGETRIDWTRGAADLHNQVRGLSPYPGAWCDVPFGGSIERIRILKSRPANGSGPAGAVLSADPLVIACGSGAIQILEVQRAGKKPVRAAEFVRGARLPLEAVLR